QNQYVLQIFGTYLNLYRVVNGSWTRLAEVSRTLPLNTWANYKIIASGNQIKVYENDNVVAFVRDESHKLGSIILQTYKTKAQFDDVKVSELQKTISYKELDEIPEGMPLDPIPYANRTLLKGSGNAVYMMMGGQKKYVPAGDSSIWNSYGLNPAKITTISDEELANILTADGLPRLEYYGVESHRVSHLKTLINIVAPFIPVIGQLYTMYQAFQGIKKGDYLQGALGFLGGLGELAKLTPAQLAKFGSLGKLAANLNNLNNIDTISKLVTLADTINKINYASIALTGNDLTDGSGRKINGSQRFIAGLNYMATDFSKILPKGLNSLHLPFSNTISPGALKYMTKTYQLGVAATGKEGVLFGKELSDEERINIGTKLVGSSLGNIIANGIDYATDDNPETGITDALKEEGMSFYKGAQAWSQMAIQAYQNASRLVPMLNFTTTTPSSIPKDQDAYIKLDIAHELWQTVASIRDTGSDIFTSIRDAVRESRKDYDLRIAYKKGELPADVLAQKLNNKEINVEDVYQLAVTYGADATKLIALATKNATNQELMELIHKDKGSNKEVSEALKGERNERINEAIKEFSSAITPQLANASDSTIPCVDFEKGTKYLLELMQMECKISTGETIITPEGSTIRCIGVNNVVAEWWKGILRDAGIAIEGGIAAVGFLPGGQVIETVYDIFMATAGYSLAEGKLSPVQRALVAGAIFVPGMSGVLVKNADQVAKEVLHIHHALSQSKKLAPNFARAGLDIEEWTVPFAKWFHNLKPYGIHTGPNHWNKQWEGFFEKYGDYVKDTKILEQLKKMDNEILEQLDNIKKQPDLQQWQLGQIENMQTEILKQIEKINKELNLR
ncbi:MAG: family 16 glycoside hydrolase, partial [bacterium]